MQAFTKSQSKFVLSIIINVANFFRLTKIDTRICIQILKGNFGFGFPPFFNVYEGSLILDKVKRGHGLSNLKPCLSSCIMTSKDAVSPPTY